MMFTQQTEATTCPTIEPTTSRGVQLHEESACKPGRGAPSGNKNAETHGYYRRKIKLEAVSFDDLNFSSSGGEQLPQTFHRIAEPLWWRAPCLCCPASHHRARCLHRIPVRLPRFVPCRVGAADSQPPQAHIDPDRPRTRCSREHAEEAVRPNRS